MKTSFILISIIISILLCLYHKCNKIEKQIVRTEKIYPEKYFKIYYQLEGGKSKLKRDNASNNVKGVHTNKGLTYKLYKETCKMVLNKSPNRNHFLNIKNTEIEKIIHYRFISKYELLKLNSQNNFNLILDSYINCGDITFYLIKRTLNINHKINRLELINEINRTSNFYDEFKNERKEYYNKISKRNKVFLKGWLNRIDKIKKEEN